MQSKSDSTQMLSDRFEEALVYAARLHAKQTRKRSCVPYIAHLLGVTGIVLEDGGSEDEAIAALLHDAVEDQGGLQTLESIREKFGETVAEIVLEVSDSYSDPKPPWRERKQAYIDSIREASPSAMRVSLADKVYNAGSILQDLRRDGDAAWDKFNGGKDGTLWYYDQLVAAFEVHGPSALLTDLSRIVKQINEFTA
jgi:(p)ppGpp synthase/HD superfamily hydrolase